MPDYIIYFMYIKFGEVTNMILSKRKMHKYVNIIITLGIVAFASLYLFSDYSYLHYQMLMHGGFVYCLMAWCLKQVDIGVLQVL